MERKKANKSPYYFPFKLALIGWLVEIFIFGSLGLFQQISTQVLWKSLVLLSVGWWTSMLFHSLLTYLDSRKKKH